jgi:rubredoxin
MKPVILAVTRTKLTSTAAYDEIAKAGAQTLYENAVPNKSIYVYVYGQGARFSIKTETGQVFSPVSAIDRNDILPALNIPGIGGVKQIEVTVPASQTLKAMAGAQRYGPVLFTKILATDAQNDASPLWPLCVLLNVPVILGVTTTQVKSGSGIKPADVYADLLRQNLATLVKGATPGHIQRGAAAEEPPPNIYIYGANFDLSSMLVNPVDLPGRKALRVNPRFRRNICTVEFDFSVGPLAKKFQFDLQEIGVALPTVAELQNSSNYLRNTILMAFGVQIVNGAGADESNVWQLPLWLPIPRIEAVAPDKKGYGNGQLLGNESSANDRGEVRWYLANPFNEQRKPLDKFVQGVAGDLQKIARIPYDELSEFWTFPANGSKDKKTVVLPNGLVDTLKAIREAGEICEVNHAKPNCWIDDTVLFHPPYEKVYRDTCGHEYDPEQGDPLNGAPPWTPFAYLPAGWVCPVCKNPPGCFSDTGDRRYHHSGMAVVWRGDVPSLPLPVDMIEYVKDLARRLWRPVLGKIGGHDFDLPVPVPAANSILLGVERLEDLTNELIGRINYIDPNGYGLTVKFAFVTGGMDTSDFKGPNGVDPPVCTDADKGDFFDIGLLEAGKSGVAGPLVEFFFNPLAGGEFDIQLHVQLDGKLRLFGKDVMVPKIDFPIGPRLRFHAEKFAPPAAAIFFQQPGYDGAALVALQPGWFDRPVHVDVNTDASWNKYRNQFIGALDQLKTVLEVVEWFAGSQRLATINTVLEKIVAIGRTVVDSHGTIENVTDCVIANQFLGEIFGNSTFNDDISSVVMIGAPGSTVKCWEHSLRRNFFGRCLVLNMPQDQLVYTVEDFSKIKRTLFDPTTLDPNLPSTVVEIDFDNKVTGIEFV